MSESSLSVKTFKEPNSLEAKQAQRVFDMIFPALSESGIDEFSDTFGRGNRLGCVAVGADTVAVGMAVLSLRDPDVAQLEYFGVLPKWQRQHIGSAMLQLVEAEAAKAGRQCLMLRSVSTALPFFCSVVNDYRVHAMHGPMTELYKELSPQ